MRQRRIPSCHPERKHFAKGFCQACYYVENRKLSNRGATNSRKYRQNHAEELSIQRRSFTAKQKKQAWRCGMSVEEYQARIVGQSNCAVCDVVLGEHNRVHDHDHGTGQWREFLCNNCNLGLGHFMDSELNLLAAVAYLLRHRKFHEQKSIPKP